MEAHRGGPSLPGKEVGEGRRASLGKIRHSRKRDQHRSGPKGEKRHEICGIPSAWLHSGCEGVGCWQCWAGSPGWPAVSGHPERASGRQAKGLRLNSNGEFSLKGLTS